MGDNHGLGAGTGRKNGATVTPQYAACVWSCAPGDANAAAVQAFYLRQTEIARQNQSQNCVYFGSNKAGPVVNLRCPSTRAADSRQSRFRASVGGSRAINSTITIEVP